MATKNKAPETEVMPRPLFDVDNMFHVFEYSPNLWRTTIEKDMPNLCDVIKGTWDNYDVKESYRRILRGQAKA